ncbi:PRMT5-domain-containing protein [Punctularia strigosozonata HHB-11173 SS5]|uniref:Protein arginine N-methyltransferase n=1 Tax=Punctularia strigosozonata (strain HHB-11173) TaxID=741275 RepID=R7S5P1_PUNST|nr:PRMT5-domain-containing protein [Punctularia strigosozonata HHB-11173 SS5]EIN04806.1 PRMT5-domain-containing protein [Punctularia strigosozonata HHB-11173 SS5]
MSDWHSSINIATLLTLEDVQKPELLADPDHETPLLKLAADTHAKGYDALCVPLTTERWRTRWREMCLIATGEDRDTATVAAERRAEEWREKPAFLLDEVTLTRLDEAANVIAVVSDWLELDSEDDWLRHDFEIALQQELAYATYLNIGTAILPPPRNRAHAASYGRAIGAALAANPALHLSLRLPIYDPAVFQAQAGKPPASPAPVSVPGSPSPATFSPSRASVSSVGSSVARAPEGDLNGNWEMWDVIRSVCDYHPHLSLTLDLTPPLPSGAGILDRWAAEPLRHVFLPSSAFIANAKGYPVLPKGTQSFIRDIIKASTSRSLFRPAIVLGGVAGAGAHARGGEGAYLQYVRHLEKTSPAIVAQNTPGTVEHYAYGYQDYLQSPLQPLMDNLQSLTYQTFEKDPVKYRNYEEAVFKALVDWPAAEHVTICVAGAGRGPLVARCLTAADRARRKVVLYAVEKNPNAYVTLQHRNATEWEERVKLFYGDMRAVELPAQVDILVSELLGSFGDNELSPECLDGAQRFLQPNGISIPASYTSWLAPLSSSKLHNEARRGNDVKAVETTYVVMFKAVKILSGAGPGAGKRCGGAIQECWEFEHPRRDVPLDARGLPLTNSHNVRSKTLNFHIPHAGVLHGFAGYFEAVLYGDIGLSIHPERMDAVSKDMLSWFPLFIPIKDPLYLPSNSELQVSIWRLTNKRQVWYEWYAESFMPVSYTTASVEKDASPALPRMPLPRFPSIDSRGSLLTSSQSTPVVAASPLVDAVDVFPFDRRAGSPSPRFVTREELGAEDGARGEGVVKIGQTALHNPGGRSCWIGLM